MRGVIAIASAVVLSACTSDHPHRTVTPSTAVPVPFVRECGSAALGEPNLKNAVTIGPLVLVGIPQAAAESRRVFGPHEGRYYAVKVLAVVNGIARRNRVGIGEPTSLRGLALRSECAGEQERVLVLGGGPQRQVRGLP
jgi:hypothetical protein